MKIRSSIPAILAIVGVMSAGCASRSRMAEPAQAPAPPPAAAPAPRAQETPAPEPRAEQTALEPVYFGYDSSALDAKARATLDRVAALLREGADRAVTIEGHCDERGTVEYNLALGERRAMAARDYLVAAGVPESRLRMVSYGKERPFAQGSGENVWAQNRRAHFTAR